RDREPARRDVLGRAHQRGCRLGRRAAHRPRRRAARVLVDSGEGPDVPSGRRNRSWRGRFIMRYVISPVAVVLAVLLGLAPLTFARAPAHQPPPPWTQGQPSPRADSTLAPIAQPPAPKAASEIPIDKIKVPPGFKVELWASGLSNARAMTWGEKGTLF